MRARYCLASLALLLTATPAAATDWYLISEAAEASSMSFVDRDSIRPSGEGLMQAQLYLVYAEDRENGDAASDLLMEYDCVAGRSRFLRLVSYDRTQRRTSDEPGSGRWSVVEPDSQHADIRNFICSRGRSLATSASRGAAYPFEIARARMAQHRAEDAQRK